ncbi:tumor necrosis factor receptor superfamily member 16 isoform X2 [Nematostella vectensis]|uniref:tumor necrosis factor receptor superfamily member 16 isoform X2 n=1 Tax=Nematostella vectensis TaxID=45351 RepID=UPI0020771A5A|nr:tumor necrosis factor receptor superfamily member 16 isoform X2 [Nematostella vectensis]
MYKLINMYKRSIWMEQILFGTVLYSVILAVAGSGCPDGTFNEGDKCCKLCPPGTFLVTPCGRNNTTDSVCDACPINTFMSHANRDTKCEACTPCPNSMFIATPCSPTADTICSCAEGKYYDTGLLFCKECTVCRVGHGATRPCSTKSDTECHPCEAGTFSDKESLSEPCRPCRVCSTGYVIATPCSSVNNTKCTKSRNTSKPSSTTSSKSTFESGYNNSKPSSTTSKPSPGTNHTILRPSSPEWIIPTIAVLGTLLVLLAIVGLYHFRTCIKACLEEPPDVEENTEVTDQELSMPLNPMVEEQARGLRGRHKSVPRRSNHNRDSSDSSTGSQEGTRGKVILVRDLPADVIQSLALMLNPSSSNDWTRLASELGYTALQIANWKLVPLQSTQQVLHDWGTRDTSTVEKLYRTLISIKRDDAAAKLKTFR